MTFHKVINECIFDRTDVESSLLYRLKLSIWMSESYKIKKLELQVHLWAFLETSFHFILPSKVIVCHLASDMASMKMAA